MITKKSFEKVSHNMAMRMESANLQALEVIANRVKEIGRLTADDVYRLELLRNIGADVKEMETYIAQATAMNIRDVDRVYKYQAKKIYKEQTKFYKASGIEQVPFEQNAKVNALVTAQANVTKNTFRNISNSTVMSFSKKNAKGEYVMVRRSVKRAYQDIVDEAINIVKSGALDYNTAIEGALNRIADSGIRYVNYESERTMNLYSAVRMNVMDGMKALAQDMRAQAGQEFGADGIEIDAHELCAEDHLGVQGRTFACEDYGVDTPEELIEAVNEQEIESDRGIGEWNCMHSWFPIKVGVSEPVYSKDELDEFAKSTTVKDIDIGGTKYSRYECGQLQRKIEHNVRQAKIKRAVRKTAGKDTTEVDKRLKMLNNKYAEVSKKSGLSMRRENLRVPKNLLR